MSYHIYVVIILAVILHVALIFYGDWQDQHFDVKYTDIDYSVFTDAAKFVVEGQSPFKRHTYRYTPLISYLLMPNILLHNAFGKFIFSLFNVATGAIIYKTCRLYVPRKSVAPVICAFVWLFNPLTFTVSTRGNAESIMTFLISSMVSLLCHRKYFLSGLFYGFSVHLKLYPVIYSLPIFIHLSFLSKKQMTTKNLVRNVIFPNKNLRNFVIASLTTFLLPTVYSLWKYSNDYYNHAVLYHISRRDVRHNFSAYFYMLYLTDEWGNDVVGSLLFVPQFVLFVVFALKYSFGNDITFCLFCETFIFVMFNKVCTSQYFLWFLCLLSTLFPFFKMSFKRCLTLVLVWFLGQAVWLYFAYELEFQGENSYLLVCASSLSFFIINCEILSQMIRYYCIPKQKGK